jgi:sulfate transport system ATP-binding protein
VQVTTLFVTHDQEEALEVSDRVVIMSQGRIEQVGTPEEVYDQPANSFVYHFLGSVNLFQGRTQAGHARVDGTDIEIPDHSGEENIPMVAYARPHDIEIHRIDRNGHGIEAVISRVYPAGPIVYLELNRRDTGQMIEAEIPRRRYRELGVREGERVSFIPRNLMIFADLPG